MTDQQREIRTWAVGVTTAPRPNPTFQRTLAGLHRAGWDDVRVFDDVLPVGAWSNWLRALGGLLEEKPQADAYLIVQDDVIFCRKLRAYLEATLWPASDVAVCSPYCPTPYVGPQSGWHDERRGWSLVGALIWAIPPRVARAILADLGHVKANRRIDARIGLWAQDTGRSVWFHTPSLAQHVGNGNSALGDPSTNSLRRAADFPGQDVSALDSAPPLSRQIVTRSVSEGR